MLYHLHCPTLPWRHVRWRHRTLNDESFLDFFTHCRHLTEKLRLVKRKFFLHNDYSVNYLKTRVYDEVSFIPHKNLERVKARNFPKNRLFWGLLRSELFSELLLSNRLYSSLQIIYLGSFLDQKEVLSIHPFFRIEVTVEPILKFVILKS